MFNFDDDIPPATGTSNGKGKEVDTADDDFDDFQSATATTTTRTTAASNFVPSAFNAPPVQLRPNATTSTSSFTSSFTNLSISSPPIAQPPRPLNPQPTFGLPPTSTSTAKPLSSAIPSQPNYFSQPPAPTTVTPPTHTRLLLTRDNIDCRLRPRRNLLQMHSEVYGLVHWEKILPKKKQGIK